MFVDRLSVRSDSHNDMGGYGKYVRPNSLGSPRERRRWGWSQDRLGLGGFGYHDMGGYGRYGGNMGGSGGSRSPPAPPPELTFDDIFAQADPDKKYANKYEVLKTALAAQDIHTVAILAELSTAEVSQIPDLTAGLRRFLEKSISPHRPQPMFDDRLSVRSDFRDDMGGDGKYGRRRYDMDGYGN